MATELSNKQLIVGSAAGLVAAAIGPLVWYGVFKALGINWWIPPLLTGLLVGGAVRLVGGSPRDMRPALAACVLTVLACVAGYFVADAMIWEGFILGNTIRRMLNDLFTIILIALGTMIAFALTRPKLV